MRSHLFGEKAKAFVNVGDPCAGKRATRRRGREGRNFIRSTDPSSGVCRIAPLALEVGVQSPG